jgi:predicted acetyltransferase
LTLELRPIREEEFESYDQLLSMAFGGRRAEPEGIEHQRRTTEMDRTLAAFDGGRMIGTAGIHSFDLGLPGGTTAAAAGVTRVSVAPTHRRQGVLRQLMRRQLDDVHERGEALAILHASEAPIYGRFGYGVATWYSELTLARSRSAFVEPVRPRVEIVAPEEAVRLLPAFHDSLVVRQPGMITRSRAWWELLAADPPSMWRGPGGDRQFAVHRGEGAIDGLAVYRVEPRWEDGTPSGTVHLGLLLAANATAFAELWRFCLDLDLMTRLRADSRPLHEPLRLLLEDPRALMAKVEEGIWARLVDVPAALAARRFQAEDGLVLEVVDDFCAWNTGRWELDGGPEGAECRSTSREPDLVLTAAQLGWCYLGANRFGDLVRTGRAAGSPEAARRGDAMFASDPEAWCPTHF